MQRRSALLLWMSGELRHTIGSQILRWINWLAQFQPHHQLEAGIIKTADRSIYICVKSTAVKRDALCGRTALTKSIIDD